MTEKLDDLQQTFLNEINCNYQMWVTGFFESLVALFLNIFTKKSTIMHKKMQKDI